LDNVLLDVLCSPQPTAADVSLQTLAQFLGIQPRALSEPPEDEATPQAAVHIAATSESLEAFQRQPGGRAWLARRLAAEGSTLFLTGIAASTDCPHTISSLLPGIVESVDPVTTRESAYNVGRDPAVGMPQFAGLAFGPVNPQADGVFVIRHGGARVTELVTIDGRPCYIRVERYGASYFVLACARVLDIDAPARCAQPIDRFLQFAPFLAYLRLTFGALCWHNENPSACFIIDDPLLKKRYGFLDFNRIEARMARSRFSMNIAFIPWNCRRTDRRVAERFKRSDRRFSISVHGCDHTEGEFGATDERWLRSQSRRALSRMEEHQALTGITHNRVMVFPQGVFSKASLQALSDEGFLAAVNSTMHPVDAGPDEVTYRDLMEMAVVRFGGTPLFLRHYSDRREKIALDLLLGRQVLIVEHHGFFKRGYDDAEQCTAFVNSVAPGINWTDLEELCTSASVVREALPDGVHVRAFGPVLRLRNLHDERLRYRISNVSAQGSLDSVTWNGRAIDFDQNAAGATCDLLLDPGDQGTLVFHRPPRLARSEELTPAATARFKVLARRLLCEIRDNYLDRSAILGEFSRRGKSLLPRL
jgi:hypothetical protein